MKQTGINHNKKIWSNLCVYFICPKNSTVSRFSNSVFSKIFQCLVPSISLLDPNHLAYQHYSYSHRCRTRQTLGMQRIFARNSSNLPEKFVRNICLQIFSHKDHQDIFLVWPPKKGLHVFFCKRWAPFFPWFSGILLKFSEILPGFSTNKNFWGYSCTPPYSW